MQKNLKWKLLTILAFMVICVLLFVWPEADSPLLSRIKLGLDLKGGMHLVLEVKTDEAINQELSQYAERISQELRNKNIPFLSYKKGNGYTVEIGGIGSDKKNETEDYLRSIFGDERLYKIGYAVSEGKVNFSVAYLPAKLQELRKSVVQGALDTIRRRVDDYGAAEPNIQLFGSEEEGVQNKIMVELPGVQDESKVKRLIDKTAQLKLCLVKKDNSEKDGPYPSEKEALEAHGGIDTEVYEILSDKEKSRFYVVNKTPVITGNDLKTARAGQGSNMDPLVHFFLKADGAKVFKNATETHIGHALAIILDKEVKSAPTIHSTIEAEGEITGRFTSQETEELARLLRSGALPASIAISQEEHVGASLGNDSIRAGIMASIIGFGLVVIIMIVYYKKSGLNAIWCLVGNLIMLLGYMGLAGTYHLATLTLPGIAGVILTIGMAVDSNILIFERIREEIKGGKTVRAAIDTGFKKVFWTIFDTHVTTLISAAFLFWFGTGPIRGFAVTLAVGLVANMITAIFVSHCLFELMLGTRKVEKLSI
jgi:preprotein translocase subunit SecD